MPLSNPRLLVDGTPTVRYTYGREGALAVDVVTFPGGDVFFEIEITVGGTSPSGPIWQTFAKQKVNLPAVGATPEVVLCPIQLDTYYGVLDGSFLYDIIQQSWALGQDVGYNFDSALLGGSDDDVLYPVIRFTASSSVAGVASVTSTELRRAIPEFHSGNKVDLLVDGNEALPALLAAINTAQHHIHIDVFFFSPDDIGKQVVAALQARARAGVQVRVLFDSVLTSVPPPTGPGAGFEAVDAMMAELRNAGVYIEPAEEPVPSDQVSDDEYAERADRTFDHTDASATNRLFRRAYPFTARPHWLVDHSKLVVIDGTIGFTGGMNVASNYMFQIPFDPAKTQEQEEQDRKAAGQPEAFEKWHDVFVRLEGPVVADMQRFFIERWAQTTGDVLSRTDPLFFPGPQSIGPSKVKFMTNAPGNLRDITCEYLRMFTDAQTKLLVENPYVTDDLLMLYLCDAAKNRQVDTTLILPDEHHDIKIPLAGLIGFDWRPVRDLMRVRYGDWIDAGVKLYEYRKRMTHVKVAVADTRWVLVGSYNLAKHAAHLTYETNVLIDDPVFAALVEQRLFAVDLSRSTRISTAPTDLQLPPGTDFAEPVL